MSSKLLFGNCAELRSEKVDPKSSQESYYIGLEHIEQQTLSLVSHGYGSDVDSQKQRFYEGDILFGKLRPYFRKVVVAPFDGICSTDIWVVKPKAGVDRNFLFYWMASEEFIASSMYASEGGRMPRAKWDWVCKFESEKLTFDEQVAIGKILRVLDQKIATNNALSKTLEEIAQTIFKSWFIDFDPVKAKMAGEKPAGMDEATTALFPDSMEESELGLIPKGWKVRSIGDSVIKQKVGKLFDSKTSFSDGSVPVLDQGKSGVVGFHDEEPGVFASPNEPLVVFANHTCLLRLISYPFSVIQNVFALVGNKVDVIWLYFAVEGKQQFDSYKGHWPDFVLHKIIHPTENATNAFRLVVEPLLKQKWLLEQQSKMLANLRDSLLPRLISGELQIPEEMLAS
jgi:type I restriction enzyme S subunit